MFEKICELLAEKFDADASTMTMDTKIKEDLEADSLDIVELMMDLEEEFGITIPDEEATQMVTIGDVVKYLEENK
ncbi:MAG: acyl carrier protein [Agathobaculum sp.]|jgi:acyl carrier protein|uniref:acyl carrier protein n=1 Tax=Agathobaculum sp. TaxID=2048138 RepID=UPI003D8C4262